MPALTCTLGVCTFFARQGMNSTTCKNQLQVMDMGKRRPKEFYNALDKGIPQIRKKFYTQNKTQTRKDVK